jgi:hypothetical protein
MTDNLARAIEYSAKIAKEMNPAAELMQDQAIYGISVTCDGKRIDPTTIYIDANDSQVESKG